ncbi:MAG: LrgB family protein [Rikenellaceae bacterium]|nr:LrgB family protein [Rikenellaceae bacterium]
MKEFISSQLFLLTFTVATYLLGVWLFRLTKLRILNPVLTSILMVVVFLKCTGVEYARYQQATALLDFMLGVSVVALGYLLYEQMEQIRGRLASILSSVVVGSVVGIVSVVLVARWLGADEAVAVSLQPKSVTAPIAIAVSEHAGGLGALTSVVVVITGILGSIVGPAVLDRTGVSDRIARGLAMGSAAHAIGTARAIELGAVEGAVSGLAIGLMGLITTLMVPLLRAVLF